MTDSQASKRDTATTAPGFGLCVTADGHQCPVSRRESEAKLSKEIQGTYRRGGCTSRFQCSKSLRRPRARDARDPRDCTPESRRCTSHATLGKKSPPSCSGQGFEALAACCPCLSRQ
eukprot:3034467-Rhodomonas_salina.2